MAVNVNNLWVVIRREFLERVRKKFFVIMTLLMPLLFGAFMVAPAVVMMMTNGEKVDRIVVLDKTGWMAPILLARKPAEKTPSKGEDGLEAYADSHLSGGGVFVAPPAGSSLESLKRKLAGRHSGFSGILKLEPSKNNGVKAVFYGKNLGNMRVMSFIEKRSNRAFRRHLIAKLGIAPGVLKELQRRVEIKTVKVEKGGATQSGSFIGEYIKAMMFAMLLYALILTYGQALMRGVMEEKNNKIVEVLLSSVKPFELMLGKIVGIGSVGLLQYAIWFAMGAALVIADPLNFAAKAGSAMVTPGELLALTAFYLLGYFFYASIYAAIGAVCTTDQEAQQWQIPIILCLVSPMILLLAVLQNPNATWITVLSIIPFFAPTLMVMRFSLVSVPAWQIVASLASLALGTVVVAYLGGKVYRVGVLMTGKRPSIPEILRWMRFS